MVGQNLAWSSPRIHRYDIVRRFRLGGRRNGVAGFDVESQTIKVAVAMALLKADAESRWNSTELQQAAARAGKICMLEGGALDQMDAMTSDLDRELH